MSIGKIIVFIVFIVVVVVGLYVAFSQGSHVIVQKNEKATSSSGLALKNTILWWKKSGDNSSSSRKNAGTNTPPPAKEEKPKPKPIPPSGFSEKDLSPFYKQVKITAVYPPNPSSYAPAHVFTLAADANNKEPLFITGWKVRGNRGSDLFVPNGIADMNPASIGATQTRIALAPSEYATFYTNASAIGRNFRLNKCTGFLNNFYSFTPALPKTCPALFDKGETVRFTGGCQSFLFRLSACANISPNDRNQFGSENDIGCRDIMDRYNFGYCYNRFHTQPDFFSREWRIWLGDRPNFDREHDRILLFDNAGLLVDEKVY